MKTIRIFSVTLFAAFFLNTLATAQTAGQNKEAARKIMAAVDAGDLKTFAMYVSPKETEHIMFPPGMPETGTDFERVQALISAFHVGFPDSKTEIMHMIAEGDIVTVHSMFNGTNTGMFMGMPATGKKVRIEQVDIIRFDAMGKAVEHWAVLDQLTMMQQLGLIPADGK